VRIAFVSWPGYGHLLPMVPLLRAAQRAGHEVVVSSGADLAEVAAGLHVPFRPSGLTAGEGYARLPDVGPIDALPEAEQITFAARNLFGPGAIDRARDLAELMETWRPDLVVHDTFELGSPTVAAAHGVPHVTHGYGPMLAQNDAMVAAVGEAVASAGHDDPVPAVLAAPYLDICPPALHPESTSPWLDRRGLRPSAGEAKPDQDLGDAIGRLPHPDTGYVTLGTVMNQVPEVFGTVVEGCLRVPMNVVVTTGPDVDSAELGLTGPEVLSRPFVPQAAVLPSCRVVVCHAGAGTMLGALCHGLPLLCVPQGTDQPLNAAALVQTGAGLALRPEELTADEVADAVRRLLDEPGFTKAASSLRDQIDAMPSPDAVLADLLTLCA
jgi:UDP:flavonoid glycosyltransferase YjiC (YdhE family)